MVYLACKKDISKTFSNTANPAAQVVEWLASLATELEGLGSNPIRHSGVFQTVRSTPTQSEFAMCDTVESHPLYQCDG